jgi:WD40 repeat protein
VSTSTLSFYQTGGTLTAGAPSYVERRADQELFEALQRGEFCYVLHARQMGKSSLMAHATAQLRRAGVAVVNLDLTAIGQNVSVEQWYDGLLTRLGRSLDLEDELEEYWLAHERLSPLQRWMGALQTVVLPRTPGRLVIFIDEIDAVRSLPFSTDELFAAIRECYNRRTEEPEYGRLSFCLLGVATPSDLIRDTRTTPFNIGRRIELTDFTETEAAPLATGLSGVRAFGSNGSDGSDGSDGPERPNARTPERLLQRILYWTGGHPYLTQRLCQAVAAATAPSDPIPNPQHPTPSLVDQQCEELFFSPRARERDDNLIFVRERLLNSEADRAAVLDLYAQVRGGKRVVDDEANPLVDFFRLAGIVRGVDGRLQVRNRIYTRVFDEAWIAQNMPDAEVRRQRAAFRRGLLRAGAIAAVILALMAGLGVASLNQSRLRRAGIELQRRAAVAGQLALRRHLYTSQTNLAQRELEVANRPRAEELLLLQRPGPGQEDLRGWEWRYLWRLAHEDDSQATLTPHFWSVPGLAYSPDGKTLAASDIWATVKLYDTASRREQASLGISNDGAGSSLSFSPDGRLLAWPKDPHHVRLWDLKLNREAAALSARSNAPGPFSSVRFSPNGRLLAVGCPDGLVRLWDVRSRRAEAPIAAHSRGVIALAFSPDSRTLATSGDDQTLALWNVAARRPATRSLRLGDSIGSLAFSPDGKLLASGGITSGVVSLWDARSWEMAATLRGSGAVGMVVAFSPSGRQLAAGGGDGVLRLWDVATRREVASLVGHQKAIISVSYSPDGTTIASGGRDGTVKLWRPAPKPAEFLEGTPGGIFRIVVSADGRLLASGNRNGVIALWDAHQGRKIGAFKAHAGEVRSLALSRDGMRLASWGTDSRGKVWDVATRRLLFSLETRPEAFSPDGRLLACAGDDRLIHLWNIAARREVAVLRGQAHNVGKLMFSPDGSLLAVGGPGEEVLRLWDVARRRLIDPPLPGHIGWCGPFTFSPNGRLLASVSGMEHLVYVWDVATHRQIASLPGNTDQINWIGFSPDGRTLGTACADGMIRLWSTASWSEVASMNDPNLEFGTAVSPDGIRLFTGCWNGRIRVWRAATRSDADAQADRLADLRAVAQAERLDSLSVAISPGDKRRNWADALPPLDRLIQRQPREGSYRLRRGHVFMQLGQWDKAATDLAQGLSLGADDLGARVDLAWARWAIQDRASYSKACTALLDRLDGYVTEDSWIGNNAALACVLSPSAVSNPPRVVRLAERSHTIKPESAEIRTTLAAALYRAGRFPTAIRLLERNIAPSGRGGTPEDWLFLAMAYHAVNHPNQAQQYLTKAEREIDTPGALKPIPFPQAPLYWDRRLQLQRLLREAGALIAQGSKSAARMR